jgi:hypothetical protein
MPSNLIFETLTTEWNRLISESRLPEASAILAMPPGRYALFAMLEEPLQILLELRETGLLSKYRDRFINTSWSVRDLVTHMSSWAQELRRQVETLAEHRGFDYAIPFALSVIGPSQWNRKEIDNRAGKTVGDAVAEYEAETLRAQDLLLALPQAALYEVGETPLAPSGDPAARWRASIAMIVFGQASHFGYHLRQLQSRLRSF